MPQHLNDVQSVFSDESRWYQRKVEIIILGYSPRYYGISVVYTLFIQSRADDTSER